MREYAHLLCYGRVFCYLYLIVMEKINQFIEYIILSPEEIRKALRVAWFRLKQTAKAWLPFLFYPHISESKPLAFDNKIDYLFLQDIFSAKRQIVPETTSFAAALALLLAGVLATAYSVFAASPLVIISGAIALFYFVLMVFKLWVVYQSLNAPIINISRKEVQAITDDELPLYTILIPLYREERVIRQILKAMTAIDYPTDKLDIIITLEEYDHPTIEAIHKENPPAHFKTLILPNVNPKTKPKALNVALNEAKGEYLVVYDAEIIPDPDQLKKAYCAFRAHPEIAVLQPMLDHYNTNQSLLTRLFNAEFSFYYDLFLPGLQKLGYPIPLSGHSTHFRTGVLRRIGGWDPYNVTEDCDVGMRISRQGYRTAILQSISREEATADAGAWILQRTRWMKGFIQTSVVHVRHPFRFAREIGGWENFVAFFMTVPGTVLVNVFNLFYWILLVTWMFTHARWIQTLFPGPILYFSVFTFVVGNFIFTYLNLIGVHQRGRYSLVKYCLLSPLYWILLAIATVRASVQFATHPHHWEKTKHGTHLA